ncbi:MAG: radical SAM protein [Deltaproteobacteria bacterium]|nr:radical SAM protein [Deltaproteobacteria bacterium]
MDLLKRIGAHRAQDIWETETRLLHRIGIAREPTAVQWLVTSACDLACPHCRSEAGKRGEGELTTDEARRLLIDELVALGRPSLVLSGGELFLRKDIPELISYAVDQGLEWSMHSHGRHVERFEELLRRHPPRLAAISLDGTEASHDRFRGRRGSHANALRAVRQLKEWGCEEVVIGTTITRESADLVADLMPVVAESGADSWGLHLLAPEGRGGRDAALMPTPAQLRRVAAFTRRKRATFPVELCNEWGGAGEDDYLYRDAPFLCGAGRITCVVTATGEVVPCMTSDAEESEGNIRDDSLSTIWAERFGRFRRSGEGAASDGLECWLQSRNGNACREAAFGKGPATDVGPSAPRRRPLRVLP